MFENTGTGCFSLLGQKIQVEAELDKALGGLHAVEHFSLLRLLIPQNSFIFYVQLILDACRQFALTLNVALT